MRAQIALTFAVIALVTLASARAQDEPKLEIGLADDVVTLFWWSVPGHTYFIEHSENLTFWRYLLMIESGNGTLLQWDITTDAPRGFFRLRYTDAPTANPAYSDFDGDSMPSAYELEHGLDPLSDSAFADPDADQVSSLAEYLVGRNPSASDHALGPAHGRLEIFTPLE